MGKRVAAAVVGVIIIVCAVVVCISMRHAPEEQVTPQAPGKITVEMPLARVKAAVASREGVSQDNVEVYFCVPAELTENKKFAAGVVVNNQKSIVFIYDNSTNTILLPVENEYTATTSDELQVMSTIARKDVTSPYAQDHLGHFNANKIVPFGIVKMGNAYTFDYYDGYAMSPLDFWGHGRATFENGQVSFVTHEWI